MKSARRVLGVRPNSACRRRDREEIEWPVGSLEVEFVKFAWGFWSSAACANESVPPLKRLGWRRTRLMEIRNDRECINECIMWMSAGEPLSKLIINGKMEGDSGNFC